MNVRTAVGEAGQQKAAAADVAGERISDGERESDGDRGVDRVAPAFSTASPTSAASGSSATTIALREWTGSRPSRLAASSDAPAI